MAQAIKNNSTARILIADAPLPSPNYGSWAQRMGYLLQQFSENNIDYIICAQTEAVFQSARTKRYICRIYPDRWIWRLFPHWRFRHYRRALQEIADRHNQLVICVVDSIRTKHAVLSFIRQMGVESRCRLMYYQCGFSTYLPSNAFLHFVDGIQEMIYLTAQSYEYELQHNPELPFVAHILPNPIDHRVFHPVQPMEKVSLQQALGFAPDHLHFVWSSVNRPKKGLAIVLKAWERFYSPHKRAHLHVLADNPGKQIEGTTFHGFVPPPNVHRYLKAAHVGLFSAVWTEGFGLSLAEQISCGLFCIASVAGGPASYFQEQKHGIAIHHPNMAGEWQEAFEKALELRGKIFQAMTETEATPPFVTYDAWCRAFCEIMD